MSKRNKRIPVSEAETERLGILVGEMGEVHQVLGNIYRHGLMNKNPLDPKSKTNRVLLERELGDVLNAIKLLIEGGDVREDRILKRASKKYKDIQQWLHYTQEE